MTKVVYPGTFDPITLGHLDVMQRAARLFDEVIVAVAKSERKAPLFSLEERLALVKKECEGLSNIQVEGFSGLLVDFCREKNAQVIVRSVRGIVDYEYETQMALMNQRLAGVETVFLTPQPQFQHISSSLVREIAAMGGTVQDCVSPFVEAKLKTKFNSRSL